MGFQDNWNIAVSAYFRLKHGQLVILCFQHLDLLYLHCNIISKKNFISPVYYQNKIKVKQLKGLNFESE